jgi:hypothetical protein
VTFKKRSPTRRAAGLRGHPAHGPHTKRPTPSIRKFAKADVSDAGGVIVNRRSKTASYPRKSFGTVLSVTATT